MVNGILVHYWDRVSVGCSGWYPIFWNGPETSSVSEQIHLKCQGCRFVLPVPPVVLLRAENGSDESLCCLMFAHAVYAAHLHLSCMYLDTVCQKCLNEEHCVMFAKRKKMSV